MGVTFVEAEEDQATKKPRLSRGPGNRRHFGRTSSPARGSGLDAATSDRVRHHGARYAEEDRACQWAQTGEALHAAIQVVNKMSPALPRRHALNIGKRFNSNSILYLFQSLVSNS